MADLQSKIRDSIKYYQSHPLHEWENADQKRQRQCKLWYEGAHRHFNATLSPQIRKAHESLIGVHPAQFFWSGGSTYKQGAFDSRPYVYKHGTFGTGYLAQTVQAVHIVSLHTLTSKFPLVERGAAGFVGLFFMTMAGEREDRKPLQEDITDTIAVKDIVDAKMAEGEIGRTLHIYTRTGTVQVYTHFGDKDELILTGIRMFMPGAESPSTSNATQAVDIVKLLKQLEELRAAGILSEEEFSAKKEILLSRL